MRCAPGRFIYPPPIEIESEVKFSSLHHHSSFSYGDGFGTPEDHVARSAEIGMEAVALTEHGNVSSHPQLEKAAKKHGIKPIYGCEMYTAPNLESRSKWHLSVLAESAEGYRNLNRLVTESWGDGFHYYPTITPEQLFEHNEGLVVLSGCTSSQLACALIGGKGVESHGPDLQAAMRTAGEFRDVFGDRYYLETQAFPDLASTRTINPAYQEIAKRLGISLVATTDVHYPRPEDNEIQKILHTATRGYSNIKEAEESWEYDIRLCDPTSDTAIYHSLQATGLSKSAAREAINATAEIAARCNVTLPKAARLRFPSERPIKEFVWDLLRAGWKYRKATGRIDPSWEKAAIEKLKYEMGILEMKDFLDYFAMIADAVVWAKSQGIAVGPARGSAAASIVCWLLRITEVNPMLFPTMLFERFIDENREDMPDIDLDFDDARRHEIRGYLVSKYGDERVGNVCNYTRYRGKNSIDDVARATSLPRFDVANLKRMIIDRPDGDERFSNTIEDTVAMFPAAKKIYQRYPELKYAAKLEGNYKGLGVHAAGIVISNTPISDICAAYRRDGVGKGKRTVSVLAVDKWDAEYLNMIKMDFLGLQTMGMLSIACKTIGMSLEDLYSVPLDEPETMRGFTENDTIGIFQWDGSTTALINGDVQPTRFMELADINAMSRPGALFSGATDAYIRAKKNGDKKSKLHPLMDKYTGATHGQIVYQEQVLSMIRDVGGFAPGYVNKIRKIIGKKQGAGAFNEMHAQFNAGALEAHGISEAVADKIWDFLIASAGYSFNVAHSVSYAMLAFWCMWIKRHQPLAFFHAQLCKTPDDKDGRVLRDRLIKDALRHGIYVEGCDLRFSDVSWSIKGDRIVAGFSQIAGVGQVLAEAIVSARAQEPFDSWQDLGERTPGIGPKRVAIMEEFADSDDPFGIGAIADKLKAIRKELVGNRQGIPVPTHHSSELPRERTDGLVWVGYVSSKQTKDFLEVEHQSSGKSQEEILASMKRPDLLKMATITCFDDGDETVKIKINRFKYPEFERTLESIDPGDLVIVQGTKYDGMFRNISADRIVVMAP